MDIMDFQVVLGGSPLKTAWAAELAQRIRRRVDVDVKERAQVLELK